MALVAMLGVMTAAAAAPADVTVRTLYSCGGVGPESGMPIAGLSKDETGALYGLTSGPSNFGEVVKLTPPAAGDSPWTKSVLYDFHGYDGAYLYQSGHLLMGSAGALYGVTSEGGPSGLGVVFRLTPPAPGKGPLWTETILHSFSGPDGLNPQGTLVPDGQGGLYGMTQGGGSAFRPGYGGAEGYGVVFFLKPPAKGQSTWQFHIVHSFGTHTGDGKMPQGGLLTVKNPTRLFGATAAGGAGNAGTVFQISSSWVETVIHSFSYQDSGGGADPIGGSPQAALVAGQDGALFGTTESNTAFELSPPSAPGGAWTASLLYKDPGPYMTFPSSLLGPARSGSFYGAAFAGGAGDAGYLYKLHPPTVKSPAWTETTFALPAAYAHPFGALIWGPAGSGLLYGSSDVGCTVFSVKLD